MSEDKNNNSNTLATVSVVTGVMSILVLAIIFGPVAIITGSMAGSKGNGLGWLGVMLGAVGVIGWYFLVVMPTGL